MVDPNISKRVVWMYEGNGAAGTTLMDTDTEIVYYFGIYSDEVKKWNYPSIATKIRDYHTYNTRTPTLVDVGRDMPSFTHTCIPTSAQHLVWHLGKCADAGPPETFDPAAYDKESYSLSIRVEENEGSNDALFQMNGAYSTKLFGMIQAGSPYVVEQTWNYMNYNDQGDYVNLDNALSTIGVPDGSDTPYVGLPTVTYDYGGTPYVIPHVAKFSFTSEAIFSKAYTNATETAQVIHKERFRPTSFEITCVMKVDTMWDDYIDRAITKDFRVVMYKADVSEYITLDLTDCVIVSIDKEGEGYQGYYASTLTCLAASLTGDYTAQGTFGTHFKGEHS